MFKDAFLKKKKKKLEKCAVDLGISVIEFNERNHKKLFA